MHTPPRPLSLLLLACAVWAGLYEVWVVAFGDVDLGPLTSRFIHDGLLLSAALACFARAFLFRAERGPWLLISGAVLAWTFGEIYYTFVLWNESSPPIPSPADIGYLLFPPLMLAGMFALLRARTTLSPALLVDGIAVALAVGAVSSVLVFATVLESASGDTAAVVTSLAYPLLDLVLLAVSVGALAGTGWRVDRTWALLAGGIMLFWLADSLYLVRTAAGTYEAGGWFDAGWWAGLLMIALAAWQRPPARRARPTDESLRLLAGPLASGAVALELLVYGSVTFVNALAIALAAAALVFVMIRLTLTFRQNVGMLRTSRDEALTDALTGLGNRRALGRALDEALRDADPEFPAVLALFDLDGFKHYNDTFGHPAGDALLVRLGANLRNYLGDRGEAFRMGGDEFCALFVPRAEDRTTLLDGAALALSEQGDGFWIGCSYGAISLPLEATDAPEALRIADQRMYAQKHAGRASASRQVKQALLAVLDARFPELGAHTQAVADTADALAVHLGLSARDRELTRLAAELHETGRLMLPADATAPEIAKAGERVLSSAPALAGAAPLVGALYDPPSSDTPLGARIVAAADALVSGAPLEGVAPDLAEAVAAVARDRVPFVLS